MESNISKHNVIHFSHHKDKILYNYNLEGDNLTCVEPMKDIGILNNTKLGFLQHIDMVVNKSLKQLAAINFKSQYNHFTIH